MAALKTIKLKIRSVEKTGKVTKAMEAVSAAKMRKAQQRALAGRAYARAATAILARVTGSKELLLNPLVQRRSGNRSLYIVITSDKGLAGALNGAVLRAVLADMQAHAQGASVVAVGRKANDFFTARGIAIEAYYPNNEQVTSDFVDGLVRGTARRFAAGEVDAVKIAYQNFVSTFEQRPTIRTIFPLSLGELEAVVSDILPARGAYATPRGDSLASGGASSRVATYTIEPSEEEVLAQVLPRLASIFVYHALLETLASEHSARMVAMKSASDKARDLTKSLTIVFNKARQAAITREVSEITGGMEAMLTSS